MTWCAHLMGLHRNAFLQHQYSCLPRILILPQLFLGGPAESLREGAGLEGSVFRNSTPPAVERKRMEYSRTSCPGSLQGGSPNHDFHASDAMKPGISSSTLSFLPSFSFLFLVSLLWSSLFPSSVNVLHVCSGHTCCAIEMKIHSIVI